MTKSEDISQPLDIPSSCCIPDAVPRWNNDASTQLHAGPNIELSIVSVKTHGILLIPKSSKLHDYTMYSETAAVAVW